jgi:hypothetical protein
MVLYNLCSEYYATLIRILGDYHLLFIDSEILGGEK